MGICKRRPERHQRNHRQIWKCHARKAHRRIKPARRIHKSGGQQGDHRRHHCLADHHQHHQCHQHCCLHFAGQPHRRAGPFTCPRFGKAWHKGVGQRPFSRQPAKHVGQLQRHQKCVCGRPGTKESCKRNIAQKPQNAAEACQAADPAKCSGKRHWLHSAASLTCSNTSSKRVRITSRRASLCTCSPNRSFT